MSSGIAPDALRGAVAALLVFLAMAGTAAPAAQSQDAGVAPATSVPDLSQAGRGTAPPASGDPAAGELAPVEVPQPSEKALRYYRSGMLIWGFNQAWALFLPGLIAFGGFSARLRNLARRMAGGVLSAVGLSGRAAGSEPDPVGDGCEGSPPLWFLTVGLFVVLYLGIVFLIQLPIAYYQGFVRQHAYGLSNQTHAKWLSDSLIGIAVEMIVGFLLTWVPFLLLRKAPRRWWLYTTVLSVPFLFATLLIKPIWIDPLFNDFGPMQNRELERSILDLAGRAGIEGSRVFEVNKSIDTKAVNAYVTGVGGTKRIVLWDTLIARLDERELLVVMAHEMGHYVLGHVVRSILLSSIVTLASLYLVHRLGHRLIARFSARLGFRSLADVASVPLLILLMQVTSLVLEPVAYAYSRYQEHEADRFALDLTRTNHSAAMAFVKLQQENLSNPRPGPVYRLFRATHPSIAERIEFCNTYRIAEHK
ncbi:MAG: M48 family metallopeptidase [Isosphaeraceae bacterium]